MPPVGMRRVAFASFIGTLLEWYDFYIYSIAAALVIGRLYFPSHDPVVSTMASFGALASGFFARPLGGLLFGHIGDRIGRKTSLIWTLSVIGIGTFGIGVLPDAARIGVAAPILLVMLRVLQGIGMGGEYGGASLLTIEHAPAARRGFWGSVPQAASPGGLLLATLAFAAVSRLPSAPFLAWGWRVPFLLSLPMLLVGLVVRLRVHETVEFATAAIGAHEAAPSIELWRHHKRGTLLAIGARMAETVSGNMVKTFGLAYATEYLALSRDTALHALCATAVVGLCATPIYGWLADRVGQRVLYVCGCVATGVIAFPFFWLLDQRSVAAIWVAFIVAYNLGPTLMLSVQPTFFAGLFRVRLRYTALSAAYQLSSIIGGLTPLIAVRLLKLDNGRPWAAAAFLFATACGSVICTVLTRDVPIAVRRAHG